MSALTITTFVTQNVLLNKYLPQRAKMKIQLDNVVPSSANVPMFALFSLLIL